MSDRRDIVHFQGARGYINQELTANATLSRIARKRSDGDADGKFQAT